MAELTEIQERLIRRRIEYLKMKSAERMRQKERRRPPPWYTTATRDDKVYFLGYLISSNGRRSSGPVHIGQIVRELFQEVESKRGVIIPTTARSFDVGQPREFIGQSGGTSGG